MSEQLTDQMLVDRVQKGIRKPLICWWYVISTRWRVWYPVMFRRVMFRMWRRSPLLRRTAQSGHFAVTVHFIPAVPYCGQYSKELPVAQGRRPPSSDVDAGDAENFESSGALKEISNPENLMLSEELRAVVFRTIDSLPEDLKTAITLRELDGLSYEEIAEIMDCPVGTVRSRIFRAREAIDNKVQPLIQNQ